MQKEVGVDHIKPVGQLKSFDDLPEFVRKLFCGVEGLQVLCTDKCHHAKTQEERKKRNENAAGLEDEVD